MFISTEFDELFDHQFSKVVQDRSSSVLGASGAQKQDLRKGFAKITEPFGTVSLAHVVGRPLNSQNTCFRLRR